MNILIYCIANFMCAAVETDIVHHRAARWEEDRNRKPGEVANQQARQAETASEPVSGNVKSSYNVRPI